MSNPFTAPALSGWNASAPPDDGSQTAANQIRWSGILDKVGTPLKTFAEAIVTNVNSAFGTVDDAGNLTTGTLPDGRFPATLPAASGANLTALNAGNVSSGTLAVARGGTGQTSELAATRRWTLSWTIQSDPGGTPSGTAGDVFAYY